MIRTLPAEAVTYQPIAPEQVIDVRLRRIAGPMCFLSIKILDRDALLPHYLQSPPSMAFPIQAILAFLALVFLLYHLSSSKTRRNKSSKVQDVPEIPGALPIIGHLHLLGNNKSVVRWLGKMADKHGPSLMVRLGMRRLLVVSSPQLVKECFTTNDMNFAARPKADATKYMGYDYAIFPLASYGPYWREIRKIAVLELLSNQRLDLLKNIRATEIHVFIQNIYLAWKSNNKLPIDFVEQFGDLTFNMMTTLVVGKRYFGRIGISGEGDARRFRRAIHDWTDLAGALVVSDLFPFRFLKWLDFQGTRKAMKRTAKEIDYFLQMWLDEHRQRRRSGEINEQDFMDILIAIIKDAHIESYDPDSIIKATCLVRFSMITTQLLQFKKVSPSMPIKAYES
jgi:fraxetin 5-hydroxylase